MIESPKLFCIHGLRVPRALRAPERPSGAIPPSLPECEVGPVQQDGECFGEGSLSVCGYAVYLPGQETCIYVDFLSTNISHTGEVSSFSLLPLFPSVFLSLVPFFLFSFLARSPRTTSASSPSAWPPTR